MSDHVATILAKTKTLCAEFDTIRAEQKQWKENRDAGIVHESPGKYVVESTAGFFPSRIIPAYKMLAVIPLLLELAETKDYELAKQIEKQFGEAVWEGFTEPTNKKFRAKKQLFRELRKDVKASEYNEHVADIYDAAKELTLDAQGAKDKTAEQIFASIMNIAAIVADTNAEPYCFDVAFQRTALDFVEKACQAKFYLKPNTK